LVQIEVDKVTLKANMSDSAKASSKRKPIPANIRREVLIEAGYRCANPTCRQILALELHHMIEVAKGGENITSNLIALCPTDHALYTTGKISADAIYAWKTVLVSLNASFDTEGINSLLFLAMSSPRNDLIISGDGVLKFSALIASGYVDYRLLANNANQLVTYTAFLTQRGEILVNAWKAGDRTQIDKILGIEIADSVSVGDSVSITLIKDIGSST
jgi:hypothetical protein